ncbi:MAG: hypothetical protein MR991_01475 [Clostridiales bacterium]|nr:hypothetical protein [Clostridiales bacterium]MDD7035491.1 hypothetical protein [Bacillota bacterium]
MAKVLRSVNSVLRVMFIFTGLLALAVRLTVEKKISEPEDDGFQTRQFDDIC